MNLIIKTQFYSEKLNKTIKANELFEATAEEIEKFKIKGIIFESTLKAEPIKNNKAIKPTKNK